MAVKGKRYRYIGFEIKNVEIDRGYMIRILRNSFTDEEYENFEPWLTVFNGTKGIVRCTHTGKQRTVEILNSLRVDGKEINTVVTSGTIKKVKKILQVD